MTSTRWMIATAALLASCSGDLGPAGDDAAMVGPGPGVVNGPGGEGNPGGGPDGNTPGGTANPGGTTTPGGTTPGATTPGGTANPGGVNAPGSSGGSIACAVEVPGTSQLPRLTRHQYELTVRELLGTGAEHASLLAPDSPGSVDQRAWEGYQSAAKAIAEQVMTNSTARSEMLGCSPAPDEAACVRQFITNFGTRAFRRPLTPEETERFEERYTDRAQLTANGTFDEAVHLILEAFLASPSFLTRAEIAQDREGDFLALNGYEVASRLSYMLWGTMPDPELFDAAEQGALSTSDQILAQARRMLADPKARANAGEFHRHYLHIAPRTRWTEIQRDPALFPTFKADMIPKLVEETERFLDHVVFEQGGTFQDLLTSPVAFVDADLAAVYGLSPGGFGESLTPTELDPETRPGVFTRAGFLTSHSSYGRTSPILRGAFLQKDIICEVIPPPPPDVEGTPLPTGDGLVTNRQRVEAQTAADACVSCHHVFINPTGYAMEAYDAIGAIQTMDNGVPVDTRANVSVGGGAIVEVGGAKELMNAIASSPQAQRCYARKWLEHAYARSNSAADACTVNTMAERISLGNYRVVDLMADLTQSPSFRLRSLEVAQ